MKQYHSRENVKNFLKSFCNFEEKSVYVLLATTRRKLSNDEKMSVSRVLRRLDNVDLVLDEMEAVMGERDYYLYVTSNPRDVSKASMTLMQEMVVFLGNQQYEPLKKLEKRYVSGLMKPQSRYGKSRFMLDVDTKDPEVVLELSKQFNLLSVRNTPNGYHFLVEPFDPRTLQLKDVELKKDGLFFLNLYNNSVDN